MPTSCEKMLQETLEEAAIPTNGHGFWKLPGREGVGSFPWGQQKEKEADLVRRISLPQQESFKEHPFQSWRPEYEGVFAIDHGKL